jgi:hypothetical protein
LSTEQARKRAKSQREAVAEHAPWRPVHYELADADALQALMRGDADAGKQQRALNFIINNIAAAYDEPYRPGAEEGSRDTTFALGRAYVGRQIVKLLKLNLSALRRDNNNG